MPKTYTKKELLIVLEIPNKPHLIDQWCARGIILPRKKKNGDRIYTEKHLEKLERYIKIRNSMREYQ